MILHTVSRSPFSHFALKDCLNQLADEDKLLLLCDAVIAVSAEHEYKYQLQKLHQAGRLFVLSVDLKARALEAQYGQVIDYSGFVDLSIQCKSQLTW